MNKKVLFTATVDSHIKHFHIPYLKLFKEEGYETHVATNGEEKIDYCDKKHTVSFERSPFNFRNIKAYKQLKKIINEEKFDIIHCHTPMGATITRLAAKKARKNGTKVIYTAHGFHFYKGAPITNWLIYYPIEKWLSKYTDCLITINEEDYEIAKKFKAKEVELVNGIGIDKEKFKKIEINKENKLKELGLKEGRKIVLSVGELISRKNHETVIKAIKNIDNIYYLICGIGKLEKYLKNLVKKLDIEDKVIFLGYRKDINEILMITDLFVFPSYQEGLPVALMEAMFEGIPALASNIRGNIDLMKENLEYLIVPNDVKAFEHNIEKLLSNKKICNKIIDNNYKNIEKYTLDNVMIKMKKIYNR